MKKQFLYTLALIFSMSRIFTATESAFFSACQEGNVIHVEKLLCAGIHPQAQDRHGRTALHYAATYNNVEIIKLLIRKGADPLILDHEEQYAHQYLKPKSEGYFEALKLLTISEAEVVAIHKLESTVAKYGIESDEAKKLYLTENCCGDNSLRKAIKDNFMFFLEILLAYNVVKLNKLSMQRTPLHIACQYHNLQAVELLLHAGANPNIKTSKGEKPLQLLLTSDYQEPYYTGDNKEKIAQLLIKYGASEK